MNTPTRKELDGLVNRLKEKTYGCYTGNGWNDVDTSFAKGVEFATEQLQALLDATEDGGGVERGEGEGVKAIEFGGAVFDPRYVIFVSETEGGPISPSAGNYRTYHVGVQGMGVVNVQYEGFGWQEYFKPGLEALKAAVRDNVSKSQEKA